LPNAATASDQLHENPVSDWRSFYIVWTGQFLSVMGSPMQTVALSVWALGTPEGTVGVSWIAAAGTLGILVGTLVGGALADRYPITRTLLVCDCIAAALSLTVALLVSAHAPVIAVVPVLFCSGLSAGIFSPAMRSVAPTVLQVGDLERANSFIAFSSNASMLGGGIIGGALAGLFGPSLVIVVNAAGYLAGAASTLTMILRRRRLRYASPPSPENPNQGLFSKVIEGVRYVWATPWIRTLIFVDAVIDLVTAGQLSVGIPILGNSAGGGVGIAVLFAAFGAGALTGATFSSQFSKRFNVTVRTVLWLDIIQAPFLAFLPMVNIWAAVVCLLISGLLNGAANVYYISFLQRNAREDMRGRVMSLLIFASLCLQPAGQLLSGLLFTSHLMGISFLIGGVIMVVTAAAALNAGSLRTTEIEGSLSNKT